MPATIAVINALPYTGNYQSFGSQLMNTPKEGNRTIPLSFLWTNDGQAPDYAVSLNLQGVRTLQITQICALYVDNLSNIADVVFYFPDTQFRLDVPAGSLGVFPVITNGLQFYAYCPSATDDDSTFIQVLNFNPPPVSATQSSVATPALATGLSLPEATETVDQQAYTGPGVLTGFTIELGQVSASAAVNMNVSITDNNAVGGTVLYTTAIGVASGASGENIQVTSISGLNIPFTKGLNFAISAGGPGITGGFGSLNAWIIPR